MIWKLIGGFIGTLAAKVLAFFAIKRAGEKEQLYKDQGATLKALERERDALATAGSAEEAARNGKF